MATLLHIDSSVFPTEASASRAVTEAFRKHWEEQHPQGTVIYRDLAVDPVPHITADAHLAGFVPPTAHTPEQAAVFAERVKLIEELEQADAILIGAPMYNYTIPSTLKAWLDNIILMGRTAGENPSAKGTPVTVVASRGGSYAPGTPREGYEYVQTYLKAVLADALGLDLEFIVPELTMASKNPAMSELVPLYEASRDRAFEAAEARARQLAERLAA
ncbi:MULTISPECIES: FMN-dependent NADH-azoreductase [Streptomyces]|uniref:FMN dependent NADH:quinone oxidoreductase n=2 Tax=Streptomyces TaxID=1883 RepID=A0ABS9JID9_9ACTN|nr:MULTISPECIES: NAD(P)H-dependent oxidoreductase [Streptomyces]MYU27052.1 FMN-dependent NADH-azoreductase [Streptomyces sp. SID7810]CUW25889.1 FMN-dependent NADH-azoreductase 1 [Streptomyces reticuli]AKN74658.1 FMN-dependent NADH-azoreductase [Streptomyces sp. PBH53]MCG0065249.1 NAD(P)H-dependent oxidoreductase [Streptomyces tricolor]OYP13438.1 FMN-dependent NADH-azoreductase [Streptomyces sp. FBKL.4005]